MRFRKRLAALVLPAVLCISLLAGCAKDGEGVALSVCVGPEPQTLDPIYAREITDQTVLTHLYENLMRVVSDGSGGHGEENIARVQHHRQHQQNHRDADARLEIQLKSGEKAAVGASFLVSQALDAAVIQRGTGGTDGYDGQGAHHPHDAQHQNVQYPPRKAEDRIFRIEKVLKHKHPPVLSRYETYLYSKE